MAPQEDVTAEQHEVQRLLGRCMLRLQQYEGLMKAILAHHELSGPADELQARKAERVSELATTSLGNLAKLLFESYVVARRPDGSPADDDEADFPVPTVATIRTRMTLEMAPDDVEATKLAVKELVNLRNALVHHLIERFNVWTLAGCAQAAAHLVECYGRIDAHFEQLRQWAVSMDEARALAASFMQSDAFQDFVLNGIGPDGVVDWPNAGIVSCLRGATSLAGTDGWTPLGPAIAFIAEQHQEQTPQKYGCRSWPQVLHESRAFELQYRGEAGAARTAWYRQRQNRTDP
jgi:hypothetical protein